MNDKFIEIQNVEQTFKTKKGLFPALRDINLTVAKGEFVTLLGPSGSGKTTLLEQLLALRAPPPGRLLLDGRDLAALDPAVVRAAFAYAPQDAALLAEEWWFQRKHPCPEHTKALVGEFADLWFHSMVAMAHLGLSPADVVGELARREGLSGLEEFAMRQVQAREAGAA